MIESVAFRYPKPYHGVTYGMVLLVFLMLGLISIILFHFDRYFPIWVSVALMALVMVNGDEAYEAKINPETLRELEETTYNLGIFTFIRD